MRNRLKTFSLLLLTAYQAIFLLAVVPGHTRGLVRIGSSDSANSAIVNGLTIGPVASCCRVDFSSPSRSAAASRPEPSTQANRSDSSGDDLPPTQPLRGRCLICYITASLDVPIGFSVIEPDAGPALVHATTPPADQPPQVETAIHGARAPPRLASASA